MRRGQGKNIRYRQSSHVYYLIINFGLMYEKRLGSGLYESEGEQRDVNNQKKKNTKNGIDKIDEGCNTKRKVGKAWKLVN